MATNTKKASATKDLRDLLERIPTAPKVVGTLVLPTGSRYKNYIAQIDIDRSRDQDLATLGRMVKHKEPMVVAILIEVKSTTEAKRWEDMGSGLPVPQNGDGPPPNECNIHRLMAISKYTKQHITNLVHDGTVVRLVRGRYDLDLSLQNLIEELKDRAIGKGGQEYSAERTRGKRLDNEEREIKLAERRKELGYIKEFEEAMQEIAITYRESIESIPGRMKDINKKQKLSLRREIKTTLEQLGMEAEPDTTRTSRTTSGKGKSKKKRVSKRT